MAKEPDDCPPDYHPDLWRRLSDDGKAVVREESKWRHEQASEIKEWLKTAPDTIEAAREFSDLLYQSTDWWRASIVWDLWESEMGYRPLLLGAGVEVAHKRGKRGGSLLMQSGDNWEVVEMFFATDARGLHLDDPEGARRYNKWRKRKVYRGGVGDPVYVAGGLSWTLDFKTAQWFARTYNNPTPENPGHVVVTRPPKWQVLACFEHEKEVVVWPDDERSFEVVDTGHERVPKPWDEPNLEELRRKFAERKAKGAPHDE